MRQKITRRVKQFPSEEKYRLVDQIVRAARSVTANIAEGYGRFHYQEYVQFCRHARGSLYELIDHLIVAQEEGLITGAELQEFRFDVENCLAVLNGFINYLLRAKFQDKVNEPPMQYETRHEE